MRKTSLVLKMGIVSCLLGSSYAANAARLDVGPKTGSHQRDHCVVWRQRHGPWGSEGICLHVYRVCMRSGVWDGRLAFPYGGARMTGMMRQ